MLKFLRKLTVNCTRTSLLAYYYHIKGFNHMFVGTKTFPNQSLDSISCDCRAYIFFTDDNPQPGVAQMLSLGKHGEVCVS